MKLKARVKDLMRRSIAGLICAVLVATMMPGISGSVVNAQALSGDQVPTKVNIKIADSSTESGYRELSETEKTNGLAGTETLVVEYVWPSDKNLEQLGFSTGTDYELPIGISGVLINTTTELNNKIKYDDNGAERVIGSLNADASSATINFTEVDGIVLGTLGLACQIDPDATADADGNVNISFGGSTILTVKVNSLKAQGPLLNKEYVADSLTSTGEVTWKVTYTTPSSNYEDHPATLVDTIPTEMSYVSGSVTDGVGAPTISGQTATFAIPSTWSTPKTAYTFTYKTKISDADKAALLNGDNSVVKSYENSMNIEGTDKDSAAKTDFIATPAKASLQNVKGGSYKIAGKSGTYVSSGNKINWTVTLDSMGIDDYGFEIRDTLGDDLNDPTDFMVNGIAVSPSPTVIGGEFTFNMSDSDLNTLGAKASTTAYPKYVVTYSTTLKKSLSEYSSLSAEPDSVKNTIDVDWFINTEKKGSATGIKVGPGNLLSASQPFTKTADPAWKYKESDNVPAGQIYFSYTIKIENADLFNEGDNEIVDVLSKGDAGSPDTYWIVDTETDITTALGNMGWKVKTGTFKWTDGSGNELTSTDATDIKKHIGFKVTTTGKPTSRATFKTTVATDDLKYLTTMRPGHAADNKGIKNTLTMAGKKVSATTRLETQELYAIKKSPVSYNAEDKSIKWRMEVFNDGFAVSLGTLKLVDTLDDKLSYKNGSTKVKFTTDTRVTPADTDTGSDPAISGNTLTWNITQSKNEYLVMTYETTVKDTVTDAQFLNDLTFANNITLDLSTVHGDDAHNLNASANATLPGRSPVGKGGDVVGSSNELHYEVQINPYSVNLPKNSDNKYQLMDKLSEGVILNESSVKLYAGEVVAPISGGKFEVKVQKKSTTPVSAKVVYDALKNIFTVELPSDANENPYFLEYSALATKPGDLKNDIQIVNAADPSTSPTNTRTIEFKASVFASAKKYKPSELPGSDMYAIEITKVDKDNGNTAITASPATFELWAGTSKLLNTAATGSDGKAVFYLQGSLVDSLTSSLYLKEIAAPADYQLSNAITEVKVAGLKAVTDKLYTVSIQNSKTEAIKDTSGVTLADDPTKPLPVDSNYESLDDNGTGGDDGNNTGGDDGNNTGGDGGNNSGGGSSSGGGGGSNSGGGGGSSSGGGGSSSGGGGGSNSGGGGGSSSGGGGGSTGGVLQVPANPTPVKPSTPETPAGPENPADAQPGVVPNTIPDELTNPATPPAADTPAKPAPLNTLPDGSPAVTVTFQSDIGNVPNPQIMAPGNAADNPGAPLNPATLKPGTIINGYKFEGWYLDPEFKTRYVFGGPVNEDMVLYAKWVKATKSPKTGDNEWLFILLGGAFGFFGIGSIKSLKFRRKNRFS